MVMVSRGSTTEYLLLVDEGQDVERMLVASTPLMLAHTVRQYTYEYRVVGDK